MTFLPMELKNEHNRVILNLTFLVNYHVWPQEIIVVLKHDSHVFLSQLVSDLAWIQVY